MDRLSGQRESPRTRSLHPQQPRHRGLIRPGARQWSKADIPRDATGVACQPPDVASFQYAVLLATECKTGTQPTALSKLFLSLDGIGHWNRMYGPRGFLQHQCVLPAGAAQDAVPALLRQISYSGQGSFLAVLKEFGDRPRPGCCPLHALVQHLPWTFPIPAHRFSNCYGASILSSPKQGALYPPRMHAWRHRYSCRDMEQRCRPSRNISTLEYRLISGDA